MGAQQAPSHTIRRIATTLALTAVGSGLLYFGVRYTTDLPAPPATVAIIRPAGRAASARGGHVAGRAQLPREEQASYRNLTLAATALQAPTVPVGSPAATEAPAAPTGTPPRPEVTVYKVKPGDNLYLISQRFHVSQDTVVWANPALERDPDQLKIGQELNILPVDGVWHTVKAGDTLAAIAKRYKVDAQRIADYPANGIVDAGSLKIGQKLIVPGGIRPPEPRAAGQAGGPAQPAGTSGGRLMIPAGAPATPVAAPAQPGRFIRPTTGIVTQGYGKWHGAVDIADRAGTPVLAADVGTVTFAAWSGGLGNAIQIDHGDGFVTTYCHLRAIGVQVGQKVEKGQQIGEMGTTGHSTGPHLHLIFLYKGGIVNPFDYVPR